ncbi:excisionase family DNA-binding protein [Prescottella agglutinans]|uniref:Excisionase family DNA binding protein n=1 Tax=Prescottella agglutinans TaxID=1644129 RepID=A0ABT6MG23_9NOCA|nr:excisionase family DNA-binding protein [Prescottella agglutinans]MDH6283279.1 excisionase family DNA binding protein [Prescottella agglutinans]
MGAPSPTPTLTIEDIKAMKTVAITKTQAAQAMGVDPRTATGAVEDGSIPSVRIGRRVLIPRIPFLALFGAAND